MSTELTTTDGFEPQTWREAAELATQLSKASLVPEALRNRPQDVLVILMMGRELGLGPMQSLRQINVISGKPAPSADLIAGLCMKSPVCEYFTLIESTDTVATYETKRRGAPNPIKFSYSMEDATKAGLSGNQNYKKNPKAMLRARCCSALGRLAYPDVTGNLYDPEELAGSDPGKPGKASQEPVKVADAVVHPYEPKYQKTGPADPLPPAEDPAAVFDGAPAANAEPAGAPSIFQGFLNNLEAASTAAQIESIVKGIVLVAKSITEPEKVKLREAADAARLRIKAKPYVPPTLHAEGHSAGRLLQPTAPQLMSELLGLKSQLGEGMFNQLLKKHMGDPEASNFALGTDGLRNLRDDAIKETAGK